MGVLNIFSKKKKQKAKKCDLTGSVLFPGEGRLVTTSEVVKSKKFWESIMTEPEAMAYTIKHFKDNDRTATQMRQIIFEKYAEKEEPWIVSEDCLQTYGIESENSREHAQQWWETNGLFKPAANRMAREVMSEETFENVRNYAIMKAGEARVA